ncbi:MAG TPA: hypothetical protein VLX29_03535 [Nitrospirota bacterium]|nr:hypothetical protein [Nitrospirota bacterium]
MLEKSSGPTRFLIESSSNQNVSHIDIYGTVKYPFAIVENDLLIPANWCRIVLSHPNIRACTYMKVNDTWLLNIYNVDKFSEPLSDAYKMKFFYSVSKLKADYFDFALAAQDGPSYTKNHHIGFEAIPLGNDMTFIHFRYSFGYSTLGYYLMKLFSGAKIGFSIIGTNGAGNPIYVNELRGAVERDVVCHYFAILAYLDTRKDPSNQRFERRISQWYDLTVPFKEQLFEINKDEYLKYKNRDWESQQRLQGALNKLKMCGGINICLKDVNP